MEVDEKPSEDYNDIGGLDKQIEELVEAIVLPMTHGERFKNLGIKPPKGKILEFLIENLLFRGLIYIYYSSGVLIMGHLVLEKHY